MAGKVSGENSHSLQGFGQRSQQEKAKTITTQFGNVLNQSIYDDEKKRRKIIAPDELEKDHLLADKELVEDGKHMVNEEEEDTPHVVAQKLKKKIKALIQLEQKFLGL